MPIHSRKVYFFIILLILSIFSLLYFYSQNNEQITQYALTIESQALEFQNEHAIVSYKPLSQKNSSAYVKKIIDGDTIELQNGERVRLICIDTPEKGMAGYKEASKYLATLILNKRVKLQKDVSNKDRYGRSLRYVYIGRVFVNEKVVREGYAKAYTYKPDITLCPQIQQAELAAEKDKKGIISFL